MDGINREKLIKELAQSVGLVDDTGSRYGKSRYDDATGTLYCEGIALPHSSLEKIKEWYKNQMYRYRDLASRDKEMMEQYMRYAVAYNAICMLEDNMEK